MESPVMDVNEDVVEESEDVEEEDESRSCSIRSINHDAFVSFLGFSAGFMIAFFIGLIIFACVGQNNGAYKDELINTISTPPPYEFNFKKIDDVSVIIPVNSPIKTLEGDDYQCKCIWDGWKNWDCACNTPPEYVVWRSKISCLVFDEAYFIEHRKLMYQDKLDPCCVKHVDVNTCKLTVNFQYHPELEMNNH